MNNIPKRKQFDNFLNKAQHGKLKSKEDAKKKLPEKKKQTTESNTKIQKGTLVEKNKQLVSFINSICNNDYATAKINLQNIVDSKIKEKIANTVTNDD